MFGRWIFVDDLQSRTRVLSRTTLTNDNSTRASIPIDKVSDRNPRAVNGSRDRRYYLISFLPLPALGGSLCQVACRRPIAAINKVGEMEGSAQQLRIQMEAVSLFR